MKHGKVHPGGYLIERGWTVDALVVCFFSFAVQNKCSGYNDMKEEDAWYCCGNIKIILDRFNVKAYSRCDDDLTKD